MTDDPSVQSEHEGSQNLQGMEPSLDTPGSRDAALEQALDYRGDVTLYTVDGRQIQGYVFDRRRNDSQPCVRMIAQKDAKRLDIPDVDISRLIFSGRDTAAGKSWENWVKKYHQKRAQGKPANLEPDPLE